MLYPFRTEIREGLDGKISTPEEAFRWVKDNITVVPQERNPQKLLIPPVFVWRSCLSDAPSLKLFFVAVCRSLGFPSRLDFATGKTQFLKGEEWVDVDFEETTPVAVGEGEVKLVFDGEELVVRKNGEPTIHVLRQLEGNENAVIISQGYNTTLRVSIDRLFPQIK